MYFFLGYFEIENNKYMKIKYFKELMELLLIIYLFREFIIIILLFYTFILSVVLIFFIEIKRSV